MVGVGRPVDIPGSTPRTTHAGSWQRPSARPARRPAPRGHQQIPQPAAGIRPESEAQSASLTRPRGGTGAVPRGDPPLPGAAATGWRRRLRRRARRDHSAGRPEFPAIAANSDGGVVSLVARACLTATCGCSANAEATRAVSRGDRAACVSTSISRSCASVANTSAGTRCAVVDRRREPDTVAAGIRQPHEWLVAATYRASRNSPSRWRRSMHGPGGATPRPSFTRC